MKILKTDDLYELRLSIFMYKNLVAVTQGDIHTYDTRNQNALIIPRYNKTRSQSSWMYRGIHLWNSLPDDTKLIEREGAFKGSMKRMLLDRY